MGLWQKIIGMFTGGAIANFSYENLLGLEEGESIAFSTIGKFVQGTNPVTIGAQYILALTNRDRLAVGDLQTMNPANARVFSRGTVQVRSRGHLTEDGGIVTGQSAYRQAGPTGQLEQVQVLEFIPAEGAPFALFAVDSAVPSITSWGS
jgi:hypothetical protein